MTAAKEDQRAARKTANRPPRTGLEGATVSLQEERELLVGMLETLSQSRHMDEYLQRLVRHLKKYSGCHCVGIRLLDDEGDIPYTAYDGFSREFYKSESPLSVKLDKCMCINVIKGATDPSLPFYTDGGSFLSNGTTKLLASVPEETKGQTRNVCNEYGYESVALVPMKYRGRILGLIHLADKSENKIPKEKVQFLEHAAAYVAEALQTFMTEEALRESQEQMRATLNALPDLLFEVDRQGRFYQFQSSKPGLLYASPEEFIGKTVNQILPKETAATIMEAIGQAVETGQHAGTTYSLELPTGTHWFELSIAAKGDPKTSDGRLIALARDITDRKRAEKALQAGEERYALAQRAANIGSWDWDILTGDLHWSDRIEPMFGFARGEFGATYSAFLDCVHPRDRQHVVDSVNAAVEKSDDYDIEHRIIWPDGTVRWVRETGDVIRDESGKVVRMVGIVQDITERKRVDELKDEFIGMVSHELRSPMTVILGAVHTVLTEEERLSQQERRQLLEDAASEAESLSHLLGNLLELSRVRAQRLFLHIEPINIANVLQNAVEQIRQQSPTHRFVIDLPKKLPLVPADQLRVERILYNLLENAVKYSPPGSKIRVFARLEKERLVVGVSDQGIGISPQDQARLFGPFERLEDSRFDGVKGIGLGLFVCRRLAEAHDGQIWLESEPGSGSTFYFALPLRQRAT